MADQKLTELPVVTDPIVGSDQMYLVRSDVSYQMTVDQILAIIPPGGVAWGAITGTLSDQTDLQSALDAKQATGNYITALTGDVTASGPGSVAATLANTTVTPGTYSSADITVDAKGRITAASNGAGGGGTVTSVSSANGDLTVATGTTTPLLTVVSAPKWSTARNLAGNSVDGSGNVAFANKFIVQGTTDSGLSGAQFLGALGTGIVKNTTTTGVLSIAIAADFPTLNQNTTGSAATLTTPRNINGVAFDGSADITVTAAAGTLTGTTLASGIVTSSLTTVGALASGSLATGFVVGGVTMTLGSDASYDLYYRGATGVLTRLANGTTGDVLKATTGAAPSWGAGGGGSGTVTNTGTLTSNAVILGNAGVDVMAVAGITTDGTSVLNLGVAGSSVGGVAFANATSGSITLNPATGALGTKTLTIPAVTDTLAVLGTAQTFTGIQTYSPSARSGASAVNPWMTINMPADSAVTASAESAGFVAIPGTKQWATAGTVTLQREFIWTGSTYSCASGTQTFTDVTTAYFLPPAVGSGATFTRRHTLCIVDSTTAAFNSISGAFIVASTLGTTASSVSIGAGNIYAGAAITCDGTLNAGNGIQINGGVCQLRQVTLTNTGSGSGAIAFQMAPTARTSGAAPYFKWTIPADTGQTASIESPGVLTVTAKRTWASTGTVAIQREILFVAPTYDSASASQTFTNAATVAISAAPIAGANAIITNAYALWVQAGNTQLDGGVTVGTTTLISSSVALTDGAAANAGTLANAPAVGNPTKWIPINDNGTTRYIPAW